MVVERGVEPPTSKAKRRGRGCCKLLRETENLRESVQFATRRPSFPRSALKGWIEPRYSRAELDTRSSPVFTCRENCNTFARCHRQVLDEREENERFIWNSRFISRAFALLSETFEGEFRLETNLYVSSYSFLLSNESSGEIDPFAFIERFRDFLRVYVSLVRIENVPNRVCSIENVYDKWSNDFQPSPIRPCSDHRSQRPWRSLVFRNRMNLRMARRHCLSRSAGGCWKNWKLCKHNFHRGVRFCVHARATGVQPVYASPRKVHCHRSSDRRSFK